MHKNTLLIEIGTEELPPKALKKLSDSFASEIHKGIKDQKLSFADLKSFATPRRIAVIITELESQQADSEEERRGPAMQAAFDNNGEPTRAAMGFASSCGVSVEDLDKKETEKGTWLVYTVAEKGQSIDALLPDIVSTSLTKLPIPKRMRWGDDDVAFVRPVHWVVMLYGDHVLSAEILGIESANQTRGHRFHCDQMITITDPNNYVEQLKQAYVIADFDQRRSLIEQQVAKIAKQIGGKAILEPALLDEVTSMVEWPVALFGEIEAGFLELPDEVLISTMASHQKYFHVVDVDGKLMPYFITVSNIESSNPQVVKHGNERVIRPRLSDSAHFWKTDRETELSVWQDSLKKVVFQDKLGSVGEKSQRIAKLAAQISTSLGGNAEWATRAGLIGKCDLMSDMVGEFPDLQGLMGRYYAEHQQEPAEVALALEEQYMPRFSGDQIPTSKTGQAVAIADKLDSLIGIFGIGQAPTGVKDPFALRRAALGCLRIMIEAKLELNLKNLLQAAADNLGDKLSEDDVVEQVFAYMLERLKSYYLEQNISVDIYDSVLSKRPEIPYDFDRRMHAVQAFRGLPEADSLAAANKRIRNILKKLDRQPQNDLNADLFEESAERDLYETLTKVRENVAQHLQQQNYTEALAGMASLREPVDNFFDQVMVMCDDEKVKNNRLVLLSQLRSLFMEIADISSLQS